MEKLFENKRSAIFLSILAMFLWGTAIPSIKVAYRVLEVPSDDVGLKIFIAGMRFLFAGLISFAYFLLFNKEKVEFKTIDLSFVLKLALIQISLQYLFYYTGLSNTLGVKSSVIQASNSFIIVILARLLLKDEPITRQKVFSLIIGTLGILVVNMGQGADFTLSFTGEGFILISTTFGALGTVLLRKYGGNQNSFVVISLQFFLGSLILILIGLFTNKSGIHLNGPGLMLMAYKGFVSATAFTLWSHVLKYQKASEFGIYNLFTPIFGSILSVLILGEDYTFRLFIGLILVLFGSAFLNFDFDKKEKLDLATSPSRTD